MEEYQNDLVCKKIKTIWMLERTQSFTEVGVRKENLLIEALPLKEIDIVVSCVRHWRSWRRKDSRRRAKERLGKRLADQRPTPEWFKVKTLLCYSYGT